MPFQTPSESESSDDTVAEGPSFGWFGRICGLLCFVFIPPLFIQVWINDPKFLKGPSPITGAVIIGVVTLGMLCLAMFGLMANFARTRVTRRHIYWGVWRRRQLPIDEIHFVEKLFNVRFNFIYGLTILQLVTRSGKRIEITGGTQALEKAFCELETRFPKE